uniref:Putative secreted protein n=1 Tax=Anopheles darlingi TaxID=43151 RepID=A0A2M4DKN9_ANODA
MASAASWCLINIFFHRARPQPGLRDANGLRVVVRRRRCGDSGEEGEKSMRKSFHSRFTSENESRRRARTAGEGGKVMETHQPTHSGGAGWGSD